MDPKKKERARELFAAALEMAEDKQVEFLLRECDGDESLFEEVNSLLESKREATGFFAREETTEDEGRESSHDRDLRVGRRVGSYLLEKRLESGGMGVVYLATRADESFSRQVAIKFTKEAIFDERDLERFQQEREILGALEHPSIARLFDAGMVDDVSHPYFVMEYVEGEPIDAFCNRHELDLRQRLEIFLKVCQAVAYAHRQMIVHRDIKPANILVTKEGEPKLLDFGIAKSLQPALGPNRLVTRPGERRMTLNYASPEQVDGKPISAATDVYSLGVLLYELLTGCSPYPGGECDREEKVRRIREVIPPPASRRMRQEEPTIPRSHEITKALKKDLDLVLQKALRKEPERRYDTLPSFIKDLCAFLSGHPVDARPTSWSYSTRKWVARHRFLVSTAVSVLLTVALAFYRVTEERRDALDAQAQVEEIYDVLLDLVGFADPERRDDDPTAHQMLSRAVIEIREEFAERPEIQAQLLTKLGGIYRRVALNQEAIELLEQTDLEVADQIHHDTRSALLVELGRTLIARFHESSEPELLDRAEELFAEALALKKSRWREPSTRDLAFNKRFLGGVAIARDDYPKARGFFEEALELWNEIHLLTEQDKIEKALIANDLANLDFATGSLDRAIERHRRALALREEVYPAKDGELAKHPEIAESRANLAVVLYRRGQREKEPEERKRYFDEAHDLFEAALSFEGERYPEDHPKLLQIEGNLASLLHDRGEPEDPEQGGLGDLERAGELYRRVDRLYRQRLERLERRTGESGLLPVNAIGNLANYASYQRDQGETAVAEALFREVIEHLEAHQQVGHLTAIQITLADFLLELERPVDAGVEASLALERADAQGLHSFRVMARVILGEALVAQGKRQAAADSFASARALLDDEVPVGKSYVERLEHALADRQDPR